MSEFSEPWRLRPSGFLGDAFVADVHGDFIAGHSSDEGSISSDDARWHRIVACVNFCQGLPTQDLLACASSGDIHDTLANGNAERIVAAVNFFRDLPSGFLKEHVATTEVESNWGWTRLKLIVAKTAW